MQRKESKFNRVQKIGIAMAFFSSILFISTPKEVEAANLGGPSHIGTFEGSTTFTTSSSNGVNPGLYLQVMDRYGNYKEYTSEDGVLTIDGTKEGAYVTQAKLLGKTKYRDIHTGELLDQWEAGRDLELESVKMPVLKTTGKNLVSGIELGGYDEFGNKINGYTYTTARCTEPIYIGDGETFYAWMDEGGKNNIGSNGVWYHAFDKNKKWVRSFNGYSTKITLKEGECYIVFRTHEQHHEYVNGNHKMMISKEPITSYEPFKSNILTVNEEVELRGIGDIKDELNLLTSEIIKNVSDGIIDDSYSWLKGATFGNVQQFIQNPALPDMKPSSPVLSEHIKYDASNGDYEHFRVDSAGKINLFISKDLATNVGELKTYLSTNPMPFIYCANESSVKTVVLNSDYYFQPVMNRDVHVDGTILPLICSVTIPTESLSFILNPNEEKGKQFIAPEFTITNNTPASIYLALNTFEQLTEVLNDVLPTEHNDWNALDRTQSKDFALALIPKTSDGWASLTEGPRYVADSSNYYLGEVKAESSVDFTFEAKHGRAFLETLSPKYRLSFIFDFFDQ